MKALQSALIWSVLSSNMTLFAQDKPQPETPINTPNSSQTESKTNQTSIACNKEVIKAAKELIASASKEDENSTSYIFQLMGWLCDSQNSSVEKLNEEFNGMKLVYKGHDKEIEVLRVAVISYKQENKTNITNMLGDKMIRNLASKVAEEAKFTPDKCFQLITALANENTEEVSKILEGVNSRCVGRLNSKIAAYTAQKLRLASNPMP